MTRLPRVAIVGPGAVGVTLAACLADAGYPILLCGPTPVDEITLEDDAGARSHAVAFASDPGSVSPERWVVLTTKIHHTREAWLWLEALVGAGTGVVVAQNGVDHVERVPETIRDAVVPALVYINAERLWPGSVRARRTERELVVPDDPAGRAAAAMFMPSSVRVELAPDFRTAAWRKLLTNVAGNPITALTGRRLEVLRDPEVARLARTVLEETAAVGRAEGADLPPSVVEETLHWLDGLPVGATSSMLQDRLARRPLEHDGITGAVVRLAARHGIDVPASHALLALAGALAPI